MRRGGVGFDIGARAPAAIGQSARGEIGDHRVILGDVLGLDADIAVPIEAEPAQILDDGSGVFRPAALGVDVFDAQDKAAACLTRPSPGEQCGVGTAEVQQSGRTGRESGGDHGGHRRRSTDDTSTLSARHVARIDDGLMKLPKPACGAATRVR